ncbi:MAG: RNA polymerase sigma factor [Pseudonocardiaceae bacterium]
MITAPSPRPGTTADAGAQERDLVTALRRRDETAYRILVRRYTPLMLRLARPHVPSQAIAEDVVQDTWVAVLRGIDSFECRSRFTTWLMRILLNTARKRGVREHTPMRWDALGAEPMLTEPIPAPEASPEATALSAEARVVLEKAIRALPDRQRTVLVLRDVEGWRAEEVCGLLRVSAGNQRVLLHRARAAVRAMLVPRLDDLGYAELIPA